MGNPVRISLDDDNEKKTRKRDKKPISAEDKSKDINEQADAGTDYQKGYVNNDHDLTQIIEDFIMNFASLMPDLDKVLQGTGYEGGLDAVKYLELAIISGPHIEFYHRYEWLLKSTEQDKFLQQTEGPSPLTKKKIVSFERLMVHTEPIRKDFRLFLFEQVTPLLKYAYCLIRFEEKAKELIRDKYYSDIVYAFKEFNDVCAYYQDSDIYEPMGIHKSQQTESHIARIIRDDMDLTVATLPHLKMFLASTRRLNPSAENELHVIHRDFSKFASMAQKEDEMKSVLESCKKLDAQVQELYSLADELTRRYLSCYQMLLTSVQAIFDRACSIIRAFFEKDSIAPYMIMHLHTDNMINNVSSLQKLRKVDSYLYTSDASMEYAFRDMLIRLNEIARDMASCAPN